MFHLWSWNNEIQNKAELLDRKNLEWKEQSTKDLCDVVVAARDVARDSLIDASSIEIRRFSRNKIPVEVLVDARMAIGKRAAYGLGKGQMITQFDLVPKPFYGEFQATRAIPKGSIIKSTDVQMNYVNLVDATVTNPGLIVGKKAAKDIKCGMVFTIGDVEN